MPNIDSEHYELSRINAKPIKNSGRGPFAKSDGVIFLNNFPLFSVDVKEYKSSYPVSITNVAKITTDARANQAEPLIKIVLGESDPKVRWIAMTEGMFMELMDSYKFRYEHADRDEPYG